MGSVFFDVSKYLLTTVVIGSLVAKNMSSTIDVVAATTGSIAIMFIAYYVTPKDKES